MKYRWIIALISLGTSTFSTGANAPWLIQISGGNGSSGISENQLAALTKYATGGNSRIARAQESSLLDNKNIVWSIATSYSFTENFTLETAYIDFGRISYQYTGMTAAVGLIPSPNRTFFPVSANIDMKSRGLSLSVTGTLPLPHHFDMHAKLGILAGQSRTDVNRSINGPIDAEAFIHDQQNYSSLMFGAGAGYRFNTHLSISVDWLRTARIGAELQSLSQLETFDLKSSHDSALAAVAFHF